MWIDLEAGSLISGRRWLYCEYYIGLPITGSIPTECRFIYFCLVIWKYGISLYFRIIDVKPMFVEIDSTLAWRC